MRHVTIENLVRLVRGHANIRAVDHQPVWCANGINGNRLASLNLATVHVQLNELKAAEQLLN